MLTLQIDCFYVMLPQRLSKKNKHMPSLIGMQVDGTDSIGIPHEKGTKLIDFFCQSDRGLWEMYKVDEPT